MTDNNITQNTVEALAMAAGIKLTADESAALVANALATAL